MDEQVTVGSGGESTGSTEYTASESSSYESTTPAADVAVTENEHGERELVFNTNQTTGEQSENVIVEQQPEEVPQESTSPYYSNDEFVQAFQNGTADPAKMSSEQMQALQAHMQAMAQQQQQEQQRQALLQQQQQQLFQQRKQNLIQLAGKAKDIAKQQLNISDDDIANFDFLENGDQLKAQFENTYNDVLSTLQYNMIKQEVEATNQAKAYESGMNEIRAFINAETGSEPRLNDILKLMDSKVENMPYNQAIRIKQATANLQNHYLDGNTLAIIREYYDECKKEVYGQGLSKTPRRYVPQVEAAGQPKNSGQAESGFDGRELRSQSQSDRMETVTKWFNSVI